MSEDIELKLRIAHLSGQINRKEQETSLPKADGGPEHVASYPHGARGTSSWRPYRGSSSGRGRGAIHKRAPTVVHKNRSLVLNHTGAGSQTVAELVKSSEATPAAAGDGSNVSWIAKRDRHKQLINPAVYERETQNRLRNMEETRRLKAIKRDEREKAKINRHLQRLSTKVGDPADVIDRPTPATAFYEIIIDGIRFRVTNGGSRLLKIPDDLNSMKVTPKRTTVGGVTFVRSKNGNLYRAGVVNAKKRTGVIKKVDEPCKRFTITGTSIAFCPSLIDLHPFVRSRLARVREGSCVKGPLCPYLHDPDKVAICRTYLQTGTCPAGQACDLPHTSSPERVPACLHFLKGKCSNPDCRYAHVRVNPGAPVCRPFGILGYCDAGANCPNRHVFECPDYANSGVCKNGRCRLPHVDRAGQIRKTAASAARRADDGTNDEESDLSSDEENQHEADSDDVDSDGLTEEKLTMSGDPDTASVAQQRDFIHF